MRNLRKVPGESWIGGVCAGLGYTIGVPTWVIRIVFVLSVLIYGFGVLPYVLLWIFLPSWQNGQPSDYEQVTRQ